MGLAAHPCGSVGGEGARSCPQGGGSRGAHLLQALSPQQRAQTSALPPPRLTGFPWDWAAHGCFSPLEKELVSVGIGDNRTGEMIVLGHVKHKLVCSPDFEALLEHRHR